MATTKVDVSLTDKLDKLSVDPKAESSGNLLEALGKLTEDELVRGITPENVEKKCLNLCQTYIGGSWLQTDNPADVTVTRITGGLTNQLYKCSLKESVKRVENVIYPDEPLAVAIKLYQSKHLKTSHESDDERLNDTISLTIMGETGVGPKVYGIFADGMIQEFVDHEQFTLKYQSQPEKLRTMVSQLARFHHLKMPIRKNHNWIVDQARTAIDVAFGTLNAQELIDELQLEKLSKFEIREEFPRVLALLEAQNQPKVLCHNDFRGSNLLVCKPAGNILFVDAEYCAYGYRGHDIATYLNEWGFEPFEMDKHGLPTDEVIENFVRLYIEECDKVVPGFAKKPENSLEAIIKEVKVNSLFRLMFFTAWMLGRTESFIEQIPFDRKENMKFCEVTYNMYFETKERLIKDGTLKV